MKAVIATTLMLVALILLAREGKPSSGTAAKAATADLSALTENQAYALYRRSS
jgi:hypothetical protein